MEFHIHTEEDHLCFCKNSTNQTFALISSKLVYFKKHLTSRGPLEVKFPLPLNILCCHQTVVFTAGPMVGPLQTGLKDVLRNLLLGCILKDS